MAVPQPYQTKKLNQILHLAKKKQFHGCDGWMIILRTNCAAQLLWWLVLFNLGWIRPFEVFPTRCVHANHLSLKLMDPLLLSTEQFLSARLPARPPRFLPDLSLHGCSNLTRKPHVQILPPRIGKYCISANNSKEILNNKNVEYTGRNMLTIN